MFKRFFNYNKKYINKKMAVVKRIREVELSLKDKTDMELYEFYDGLDQADSMLIEKSFAVMSEAVFRILDISYYDVQLVGGLVLAEGKIAEMKTGEGKTLVSLLPCALNKKRGKQVHVVTQNSYLAKRDFECLSGILGFLGISSSLTSESIDITEKIEIYERDVIFGTKSVFAFDYLNSNMVRDFELQPAIKQDFAIVDEADAILIDEARQPLIISSPSSGEVADLYRKIAPLMSSLDTPLYDEHLDSKSSTFTEAGFDYIESRLRKMGLVVGNFYDPENYKIIDICQRLLQAQICFKIDVDYVVKNDRVYVVDEFTGRVVEDSRFSEGIHQALEAINGVSVKDETISVASTTAQAFFKLYSELSGMTGTAKSEEGELYSIYNCEVIQIPTNRDLVRVDQPDELYATSEAMISGALSKIKDFSNIGRPVLVGTQSIEASEELSGALRRVGIRHNVLNAKNNEDEAKIIGNAGKVGAVTIATNMAGRGTDIVIGAGCLEERKAVLSLGGLAVIGLARNESRRIDNQLRGRAGRQGDVGETVFFVSLEDDLMKRFGKIPMVSRSSEISMSSKILSRAIENAQRQIEGRNYEIRKSLYDFDKVSREHRDCFYESRQTILESKNLAELVIGFANDIIDELSPQEPSCRESKREMLSRIYEILNIGLDGVEQDLDLLEGKDTADELQKYVKNIILFKSSVISSSGHSGEAVFKDVVLGVMDTLWANHIEAVDSIKDHVHLRSYAQKDPMQEYKFESHKLFSNMFSAIKKDSLESICRL